MREVNIAGKTLTIEPFQSLPEHPFSGGRGRPKGPIRLLCEELRDGESAFVPINPQKIESANLYSIGKLVGGQFRYRREGDGVRIYRLSAKPQTTTSTVRSIKRVVGWQ